MCFTSVTKEIAKRPYYQMLFCQLLKTTIIVEIMCLDFGALYSIAFTFHLGDKLDEDAKDKDSALLRAVSSGNVKQVEKLLADGVSPNVNSG